jgi:hypothetical protein
MAIFSKNQPVQAESHSLVKAAFDHVKRDIMHVFDWLKYFHEKHKQHDERLAKIEQQLTYMPKSHDEIKQIIDYYYGTEHLQSKIQDLSHRMDTLEHRKTEPRPTLKEKLARKITRNSKDYVKSVILGLIRKYGRITAPQLKEILVEEQGLCSKSSFYRLLTEIEQEDQIETLQAGKEKVYLAKTEVLK